MLTEVKNNYKSILKYFDFDESISSTDYRKQKLIEMAKRGDPRPSQQKTKEGHYLSSYTIKSSSAYCPEFDKTIRKLRPDWFIKSSDQGRQKLIEMAKRGEPRPNHKTKIGRQLSSYTAKSSKLYRLEFDKLIRKLSPNWFSSSVHNKHKLIEMARNKKPKPKFGTKEQQHLVNYTNKKCGAYCPEFDKTIRKIRPDWFVKSSNFMKQKLIHMAKNKQARPSRKTKEGQHLSNYTIQSSRTYCENFNKLIRKISPNWFVSQTQIADQKRKKIIEMAKNGEPRPSHKTKEGMALYAYIKRSPNFNKIIHKLRPDWFIKCLTSADYKKQKLIAMAKSGAKKPNSKKTKEGRALVNYTRKYSVVYCQKFDKLIRKLGPDWFESTSQIMQHKLIAIAKSGVKKPSVKIKEGRALYSYTKESSGCYCSKFDKLIRKLRPDWFRKCSPK